METTSCGVTNIDTHQCQNVFVLFSLPPLPSPCMCVQDGGKALEEAMSHNTTITECDIRLTEVDEHSVSFINQVVWTNQSLEQKKEAKGNKTK